MLSKLLVAAASPLLLLSAQTPPAPTFEAALLQTRAPIRLQHGTLSGAGADLLTTAVHDSRFILLGEDHFSREIPQFATALCDLIHPDAYATEASPDAARFVSTLLQRPDRIEQLQERNRAYPSNMAFLDIREENDLAAHCAASSHNPHFQLWGLDQEFLGSPGILLQEMLASAPGPRSRAAITAAQAEERTAGAHARQSGSVKDLFLLSATDADLEPLKQAIAADGNPTCRNLLEELLASHTIYHLNLIGSPDANRVRALLLKQHFLADYLPFKAQFPQPRIFLKLGGMHTGKGFSFLHQRDLGNAIAELADAEHTQSLHIFILGARGTATQFGSYGKPLQHQPFDNAKDEDNQWLRPAVAGLLPVPPATDTQMLTLFDLRRLRFRHLAFPPEWQHVVDSYDLLILLPDYTPASLVE